MGDIDAEGDDECIVSEDENSAFIANLSSRIIPSPGRSPGDLRGEKEIQAAIEGHKDISSVRKELEEDRIRFLVA